MLFQQRHSNTNTCFEHVHIRGGVVDHFLSLGRNQGCLGTLFGGLGGELTSYNDLSDSFKFYKEWVVSMVR